MLVCWLSSPSSLKVQLSGLTLPGLMDQQHTLPMHQSPNTQAGQQCTATHMPQLPFHMPTMFQPHTMLLLPQSITLMPTTWLPHMLLPQSITIMKPSTPLPTVDQCTPPHFQDTSLPRPASTWLQLQEPTKFQPSTLPLPALPISVAKTSEIDNILKKWKCNKKF